MEFIDQNNYLWLSGHRPENLARGNLISSIPIYLED